MAAHIATLTDTGDLRVPEDIQESLGLHAGSRLKLVLSEGKLILEPLATDFDQELDELCGCLASDDGTDAVEELLRERQSERW